eukprot:UN19272
MSLDRSPFESKTSAVCFALQSQCPSFLALSRLSQNRKIKELK